MKIDILIEKMNKFEREQAQMVIEEVYDHSQSERLKKKHIMPTIGQFS
jgi:hypothetical protein